MKGALFIFLLGSLAMAQQDARPSDKDPEHKTVFRNDYLLVLHVDLPPGGSTGVHRHFRDAMAVRLSDAQFEMKFPGGKEPVHETMKVGGVTANDYGKEPLVHQVINVGKTRFDVLDVELLKRPEGPEAKPFGAVATENASMRAYRWELAPGASSPQHTHERPYLIIATADTNLKMTSPDGQSMTHEVKSGDMHWVDQKVTHTLTNESKEPRVLVEIELK